jgi:signal transduction histidine kinase/ligand-binding sensor domain-containing protein/CheY-like chemotaxis protein
MKHLIIYILLFLIDFGLLCGRDSPINQFTHISSKEGLPHNMVFSITQDQQGFIWFGTNNGLARYDGYNFRVFQPDPQKPNSISNKSAYKIYCDLRGNLWIYIQGSGLNKMDLKTEKFSCYFPDPFDSSALSGNIINYFYEDEDSVLWIATNRGIDYYDKEKDRFVNCFLHKMKSSNRVSSVLYLVKDKKKQIWFLTSTGAGLLSPSTKEAHTLGAITRYASLDSMQITSMLLDRYNNLWFCTLFNGLFCYNISQQKLTNYLTDIPNLWNLFVDSRNNIYVYADKPNNKLYFLNTHNAPHLLFTSYPMFASPIAFNPIIFNEDSFGDIWMSCYQGLKKFNPESGVTDYCSNANIPGTLAGNNIVTQFLDNTDNLWLSILRIGVDKADLNQKPFKWYLSDSFNKNNSIAGNNIASIFEDSKDNIWVGCYGEGLTQYNRKSNTFKTIPIKKDDPSKLVFNAPATMFEDEKGYLWVGYYDGQVDKINPATFKVKHYSSSLQSENSEFYFKGWSIRRILKDEEGNMWFASSNIGIIELNHETGKFVYHSELFEKDYISNSFYRNICIGKDGIIWAGTQNGGLLSYDKVHNKFSYFRNNPDDPTSISSNTVYYIFEESQKIMWVATSNGLNRFDRKNNTFDRLIITKGTSDCAAYCILPDSAGNFWISSDCGIIKFNRRTSKYTNYVESDGLPSNEFNTTAYCETKSGEVFFGSAKGMISFIPGSFKENPYKPHPMITDLRLFNKSIAPGDTINGRVILKEQIWATKNLVLSYKENDFTLEFSALHYSAPEKVQYYYKLDGFNPNWINTDSKRRWANFTGLSPGNYTFILKATNNDGIMCAPEDIVYFGIKIKPPFWKVWWFISLLAFLGILFIIMFILGREKDLKNQKNLLEQMVKERTRKLEKSNVLLEESNILLEEKQEEITIQNDELAMHRNDLETIVEERTHELDIAKKKAEESDRLKSAFLANMSHEIRTPMNAIVGFSSLLISTDSSEDEKKEYHDIINRNCDALLVLINDIIEISQIEANQIKINKSPFEVDIILEELENYLCLKNKNEIEIKFVNKGHLQKLIFDNDPIRFRQIMTNLLNNAQKYTDSGHIHFGYEILDKQVRFFVSDTGIGIGKSEFKSIFDYFHKIETRDTKLYRGAGIGLSITNSLVKLMGGEIWLESELGKGSTFYFSLPYSEHTIVKKEKKEKIQQYISTEWDLSKYKILIAEDEPANYLLLKKILQHAKADVVWAKDGFDAVNFVRKYGVKKNLLILMDIKMPVMNGIEAIKIIRKLSEKIPVIAITAYAHEDDKREIMQHGFNGYISKPLRPVDLFNIITKVLADFT